MAVEYDGAGYRPCVVLAHTDASLASDASRRLRQLGWDVYRASDGAEARRLAQMLEAEVVVLDVDLVQETGWLTCAKLTRERPASKVVLVGETSERNRELAEFVGAWALLRRDESLATVLAPTSFSPRSAAG